MSCTPFSYACEGDPSGLGAFSSDHPWSSGRGVANGAWRACSVSSVAAAMSCDSRLCLALRGRVWTGSGEVTSVAQRRGSLRGFPECLCLVRIGQAIRGLVKRRLVRRGPLGHAFLLGPSRGAASARVARRSQHSVNSAFWHAVGGISAISLRACLSPPPHFYIHTAHRRCRPCQCFRSDQRPRTIVLREASSFLMLPGRVYSGPPHGRKHGQAACFMKAPMCSAR